MKTAAANPGAERAVPTTTARPTTTPRPMGALLLTGFLGAGKTTLLNRILAEGHEQRTAVLINDFGQVSIDSELVVDVRGDTIVLDNGCICCSVRGDLLGAIERLLKAPADERVERVVIEASGIADPRAVLATFVALDKASTLALDGVIAVVDASELEDLSPADLSLARDQLDQADLVLINKSDLATPAQLEYCRAESKRFAPRAAVLETTNAAVPLSLLLGLQHDMGTLGSGSAGPVTGAAPGPATGPVSGELASQGASFESAPDEHGFSSLTLRFDRPLDLQRLRELCVDLPPGIFRAKGVLWLQQMPDERVVLQVVGRRARVDRGGAWPSAERASQIVLIGRSGAFDAEQVRARFEACAAPVGAARRAGLRGLLGAWWQRLARSEPG